jgi:hypothetical protein
MPHEDPRKVWFKDPHTGKKKWKWKTGLPDREGGFVRAGFLARPCMVIDAGLLGWDIGNAINEIPVSTWPYTLSRLCGQTTRLSMYS